MICHRCRKREATVHVLDMVAGDKTSIWLCEVCAQEADRGQGDPGQGDPGQDEPAPLSSFLGEILAPESEPAGEGDPVCPVCGTTREEFRRTNRLGCARCYRTFHDRLLPVLARFHRRVSHVGRVPRSAAGSSSRLGEITRTRVALEKAVSAEDFESAARLRDRLRALEAGGDGGEES
jgi:protein arginine kinase activator